MTCIHVCFFIWPIWALACAWAKIAYFPNASPHQQIKLKPMSGPRRREGISLTCQATRSEILCVFLEEPQQYNKNKAIRIAEVASDDWVSISLWARHSLVCRHTTGRARHKMPGTPGTESSLVKFWTGRSPGQPLPYLVVYCVWCFV